LLFARASGIDVDRLNDGYKREAEKAFSSDTRVMATLRRSGSGYLVSVKGAVEEVSALCAWENGDQRNHELEVSERMAADGLRTLAFACRQTSEKPGDNFTGEEKPTYLGLVGFLDPPRKEVTKSLNACHDAGIQIIMVTGD